jgi:hypothetical protein
MEFKHYTKYEDFVDDIINNYNHEEINKTIKIFKSYITDLDFIQCMGKENNSLKLCDTSFYNHYEFKNIEDVVFECFYNLTLDDFNDFIKNYQIDNSNDAFKGTYYFNDYAIVFKNERLLTTVKKYFRYNKNGFLSPIYLDEGYFNHRLVIDTIIETLQKLSIGAIKITDLKQGIKPKYVKTELSMPEKIALLKLISENTLNKIPIMEDKYRFIHGLIGGSYDNVKKYYNNGITKAHENTAKEFLNSKTI